MHDDKNDDNVEHNVDNNVDNGSVSNDGDSEHRFCTFSYLRNRSKNRENVLMKWERFRILNEKAKFRCRWFKAVEGKDNIK